jgi:hypothetical protein
VNTQQTKKYLFVNPEPPTDFNRTCRLGKILRSL